jgi:hypothetical protein
MQANRWNGTVAPQLVVRRIFETPAGYAELRRRLADEWRGGEAAWSGEARAIFEELELDPDAPGGRRQLVESEVFRRLLAGEPVALPVAA